MWFTETPWPPVIIGVALTILLVAKWRQNGRQWLLYSAGLCLAACAGIIIFERWYVTPTEQVEQHVHALVAAVETDDAEAALSFFAEENREERSAVERGMARVRVKGTVNVKDVEVSYNPPRTAIVSHFRANGVLETKQERYSRSFATRWKLTWKTIGNQWRIVAIQRLHPVTGEPIELLARQ